MMRKGLLAAAAVAVFGLGFALGNQRAVQAQAKNRIFEIRTYTANEGKLADMHAMFKNHVTPLFARHGLQAIGYWAPVDAPASLNTLVYILTFPDRDTAKKSWEAFQGDPDWKKAQTEVNANGRVVAKVESMFAEPTDYSPLR